MCLLLILSNKLDLNQETRFTIQTPWSVAMAPTLSYICRKVLSRSGFPLDAMPGVLSRPSGNIWLFCAAGQWSPPLHVGLGSPDLSPSRRNCRDEPDPEKCQRLVCLLLFSLFVYLLLYECGILRYSKYRRDVERIESMPDGWMHVRLDVMAADLSQRHKSDDFNSFLMHLFFEGQLNKEFANFYKRCGMP